MTKQAVVTTKPEETTALKTASRILSDAQRVETMGNTVSQKLLELFKQGETVEAFNDVTEQAETDWKAKRAKAKESVTLPRCWSQAKSDIRGAVKAGVNVLECDTVSEAKRKKVALNKANQLKVANDDDMQAPTRPLTAKAPSQGKSKPTSGKGESKLKQLHDALDGLSPEIQDALLDSFIQQAKKAHDVASGASVAASKVKKAANA